MNDDLIEDVHSFRREADTDARHKGAGLSVTRVLRRAGLVKFYVSRARLAVLSQEGQDVHQVCADIAKGDMPDYWSDILWLAPYSYAFQRFQQEWDFRAELIEERIDHPSGYYGHLDMAGVIFANSKKRSRMAVVEIKRAVPAKAYKLQTAAYKEALAHSNRQYKNATRLGVYLKADGRYKIEDHDSPFDWPNFQHALGTARLREQWGLVNGDDEADFDDVIRGRQEDFEDVRL